MMESNNSGVSYIISMIFIIIYVKPAWIDSEMDHSLSLPALPWENGITSYRQIIISLIITMMVDDSSVKYNSH